MNFWSRRQFKILYHSVFNTTSQWISIEIVCVSVHISYRFKFDDIVQFNWDYYK